ncbi:MAG TPA: glycosyltransferase family 2 protein [Microbacteriaceae bacterium]|nr:glycosyltransferase family 2 protein [Microbacteriaceae bacterium]
MTLATVAILTYNGERYLDEILVAVERQAVAGEVEILVIDSGSSDRTLEIVAAHPRVRLHRIPNQEFGHGRTRDLAARLATGEYVAYLTHDATPASDTWLAEILAPMIDDDRIVAVLGRQVPRPHCHPMLKYEILGTFARLGPEFGTSVFRDSGAFASRAEFESAAFYSDVNSAARRGVLTGAVPYRDVSYAEDQLFGRDVLTAGLRKAYTPRAAVIHSNDMTIREAGRRAYEETTGLRRIGTSIPPMTRGKVVRLVLGGALRDSVRIVRDRQWGLFTRLRWLFVNPGYVVSKWVGHRRATLAAVDVEPAALGPLPSAKQPLQSPGDPAADTDEAV